MSKIDLLIINPNPAKSIYQGLANEHKAIEPPLWAAMLAAGVRRKNYEVSILDCEALNLTNALSIAHIASSKPRLIAVVVYGQHPSASTQNMPAAGELCTEIKKVHPEIPLILLGQHVSALPLKTLKEESCDYICQGEGLYTLLGLLDTKAQKEKIPGLGYRKEKELILNPRAPLIAQENLEEELPSLAYDLLPMEKYRAHNWHCFDDIQKRSPYASIYTSLGCPFSCDFCSINSPFGGSSFRYWRPEFIIKKFDELAEKYNVRNIKIADEMFVLREEHFLKLAKLLIERKHNFNIWAYSRIDTIKPSHLELLKKAGVNWLVLGIESHSAHVRQGMTKGKFQEADIVKSVRLIQEAGIHVLANYIFGLPDENLESMQSTLSLAQELNCEMANFYCAMAYPGSKLYNIALEKGWELPSHWEGYAQHAYECHPLPTKFLSAKEVLAFRDHAWLNYHGSQNYLGMIERKFGKETSLYMKELTKTTLERSLLRP